MQRKDYIFLFISILTLTLSLYAVYKSSNDNFTLPKKRKAVSNYEVYPVEIPNELSFCNENVPLEYLDVLERMDRELHIMTYWRNNTILLYKEKSRWFPIIESILKEQGIPEDFKYLAVAESKLTNVVSPMGAAGFWQLMEATAKQYGLEVNEEVDERYDPIKSTYAACKYFKDAYIKFGNWTNVAASYNRGINGYIRAIKKQKEDNYYFLKLNPETHRYVFRIIAIKEVMENPKKYGFNISKKYVYKNQKTTSVTVDSSILNLVDFAHKQGVTYKTLRIYNPWIQDIKLSNNKLKKYTIKFPVEKDWKEQKLVEPTLSDSLKDTIS